LGNQASESERQIPETPTFEHVYGDVDMRHTCKALLVAMLFGAAAAPLPTHAATSEAAVPPASVLAFDQKPVGGIIVIEYAQLPANGYVAVYGTDKSGKPVGEPLGYSKVDAGDHRQLKIDLSKAPAAGDRLWVSLYKDTDNDPAFKPGSGDEPVWSKSELPVESMIVVR